MKSDTQDGDTFPDVRIAPRSPFRARPWWSLRGVLSRTASRRARPGRSAHGPQNPTSSPAAADGVGTGDGVVGPGTRRCTTAPALDLALEQWWSELPRSRRRQALLLASDDSVPEDLVVTLLLYGVLTPEDVAPLGRVPQPPEVRLLITRELRLNCAHT